MLRCLSKGLIPVSIRLKITVKTPKGNYIVRKAERILINERVRSINNTITMLRWQIDTCINSLGRCIRMEVMEECHRFMSLRRERRHQSTLRRQKNTGGCSNYQHGSIDQEEDTRETPLNNDNLTDEATNLETAQATTNTTTSRATTTNNKWVHNLFKTPLLKDQEKVLARGPNYAVVHQGTTSR